MNRVRAYDVEENKMIYMEDAYPNTKYKFEYNAADNYRLSLMKLKRKVKVYDEDEKEYIHTEFSKIPSTIMEYIGVDDKFGQPIYEADKVILKVSVYMQIGKKKKLIDIERYTGKIIKMWMSGWAIECDNEDNNKVSYYMLSNILNKDYTLEVIGNALEN